MTLKALQEKKNTLLEEIGALAKKAEEETRAFNQDEITKIEELKEEIRMIEETIKQKEEIRELNFQNSKPEHVVKGAHKTEEKEEEKRAYDIQNEEIRKAIKAEREIDVTNFEVRGIGVGQATGNVTKTTQNIAKTTFANAVIKKATETSDLYRYVRKENFGAALHQIPVQKTKITKFANVKELAAYAEKEIDFEPIQLAAHKFGNISIISEEALADTGYDIMGELLEQYGEAAGLTLDELMIKGDTGTTLQGLNSFIDGTGNAQSNVIKKEITKAQAAKIGVKDIMEIYNLLPNKYRKNATWVIGTELAGKLRLETDGQGRPLLFDSFNETPFGAHSLLLGRPVVISDYVNNLTGVQDNQPIAFFGDLSKALILGLRQSFTLKSSSEYKFVQDGVTIKGTMRLDVKRALGEALVSLVAKN